MSTLTWITGEELEWEINNGDQLSSLEEKHENYIAAIRVYCTCKVKWK